MTPRDASGRTAQRSFWILVVCAALSMGALSAVLARPPAPLTALLVAVSGVAVVLLLALAGRVLLALDRARRPRIRPRP